MSDLSRFLPLSQRRGRDDADVSVDRRAQVSQVVRAALRHLAGEDVRAAFVRDAGLADAGPLDEGTAGRIAAGPPLRLTDLVRVVRAVLVHVADPVELPAPVMGAVALAASASAPFARRAAISGHTVRAADAEWSIGRGPELVASSRQIVAFLLGLSDEAPRRPAN
ncbi:hypothetical protein [Microbacterium radiodurans]|uniref:Uncharacterized protein n=1 Tax=Microbacterium radiodurans TaxID=661398 RepID=A0A5J5IQF7_9MICO|nr:hypothetical protein [Microbacterium radiodurans]KAA9086550.1 hypothetical protein F6B42_05880 [Microbacterium radiodurans]